MANHLLNETSPYLLQHQENPVDWYPWGAEAFSRAQAENKPIFLSIGYAACHWCHVMAHESFENTETARLLNEYFISIKVDREERPDVDSVFMQAVVTMTGQGGWPMSLFLTPQGEPFYGGTYFPPERRYGMPAFNEVLNAVAQGWQDNPDEMNKSAQELAAHVNMHAHWGAAEQPTLRTGLLDQALQSLLSSYDWQYGGWGRAPRFPQPMIIDFLLAQADRGDKKALDAALHALRAMLRGGMADVIHGGFARYSTDDHWLVPHFEKMLYDNAQLALAYLHAGVTVQDPLLIRTARRTLDWMAKELCDPKGGFYSSLDADSEGEEGKYYVWTRSEIQSVLEPAGLFDLFSKVYPVPAEGNWEGRIILQARGPLDEIALAMNRPLAEVLELLDQAHSRLEEASRQRIRPHTDDKVLAAWNGFALRAFAEAGRYLQDNRYLQIAQKTADFLLKELIIDGILHRSWRQGVIRQPGFLEDYASLVIGLLALYQTDHNLRWYTAASNLLQVMLEKFNDPAGGFYDNSLDDSGLFMRPKDYQDNAIPSGNALAAYALLLMTEYTGELTHHDAAVAVIATLQDTIVRHPTAFGFWLQAADLAAGPVDQVAIVVPGHTDQSDELLRPVWRTYRPRLVSAVSTPGAVGIPRLLADRPTIDNLPTAYLCRQFTCQLPTTRVEDFIRQLSPSLR